MSSTNAARESKAVEKRIRTFRDIADSYFRRRYRILFLALAFTVLACPVISAFALSGALIESLLAATLLAAVMPASTGKARGVVTVAMIAVWLARPAAAWLGHPVLSALTLGIWTLIGLYGAAVALGFAIRATKVDFEHLSAALSAYLMAGIYFGLLYWALEQVHPGTFATTGELSRTGASYFSFVTLATLGYGDIVPRTDVARGLAIVEVVGGQLFLAVLVARLVSLYSKPKEE